MIQRKSDYKIYIKCSFNMFYPKYVSLLSAVSCCSFLILPIVVDSFHLCSQNFVQVSENKRSSTTTLHLKRHMNLARRRSICCMGTNSEFLSSSSASSSEKIGNKNDDTLLNNDHIDQCKQDDDDNNDSDLFNMIQGEYEDNEWGAIEDLDCIAAPESNALYNELRTKLNSFEQGIGKRYRTRTQLGFLNIHKQPTDPFDTSNIVGKLHDGDIITSTGPNRGDWIAHDEGWSISRFQGFQWLESLPE